MAVHEWRKPPIEVVQGYAERHPGALIAAPAMWAVWAVETLHYLDDIDLMLQRNYPASVYSHHAVVVDMGHVRWATSTAITSLDLCAAALGDLYCGNVRKRKLDLRSFTPSTRSDRPAARRAALPPTALSWIDGVREDQRYRDIRDARNPFTHSWLARSITMHPVRADRTGFVIEKYQRPVNARELVELSRSLATDQVTAFLDVIDSL